MRLMTKCWCVLGAIALSASPAFALQTVTPSKDSTGTTFAANGANAWQVSKGPSQFLVIYGRYNSTSANESGLGLKVAYDETVFTNIVIDQVMNKCMVGMPQTQQISAGNSFAGFAWADISSRAGGAVGWPGTADPAPPTKPGALTDGCLDITVFGATGPQTTGAVAIPTNLFRMTA